MFIRSYYRAAAPLCALLLFFTLAPVGVARAGSPFDDPTFQPPQGGSSGGAVMSGTRPAAAAIAQGYQELPIPTVASALPRYPAAQPGAPSPNDPLSWLGLEFNPGKWLLDSSLGSLSGILNSIASVFQSVAATAGFTAMTSESDGARLDQFAASMVFSTPRSLTVDWGGDGQFGGSRQVADIIRLATLSLLTLVFVARLISLLREADRSQSALDLGFQFVFAIVVTQGAWAVCGLMIDVANAIARAVVQNAFGAGSPLLPFSGSNGVLLSLVFAMVTLWYWLALAIFTFHAFRRIVLVNLMLMVSPAIGLAVLSGGAWNYARVWFFRMTELLITPIIWAGGLAFIRGILSSTLANAASGLDGPILAAAGAVLAGLGYLMVLQAPQYVGIAAREAVQSSAGQRVRSMIAVAVQASRVGA